MKKIPNLSIVLIVAYLFVPNIVNGEPELQWEKTYGSINIDEGYCVQQTSDGGYIIVGNTYSSDSESYDILLIKTDNNGIYQWEKTFSATYDDFARSVQQTSDGGYIIAGSTESFGIDNDADVYIIKTDSSGNFQWEKTFGGNDWEYGESVQQTSDGGYIIAGCTYSYGTGGGDVYLIKIDGNGNSQWEKTYGGSDFDFGSSVQQTSDGGYIITGYTRSYGSGEIDVYLIKTNDGGNSQWYKTFGGNDWDCGESVRQTSDGGYIITGYTYSYGAGLSDVYLIKTDDSGNSEWERIFGADYSDKGYCVQQTTDGGYIVAGHTLSFGSGGTDVYLIKTNSFGYFQWEKTFGGNNWDYGESIQQTFDGGFIIAGYTYSYGAGNSDVYLIRLSADPTAGKIIYVDDDIPLGSNNGSSWTEAYPCLQNALDDAEFGDMICVAGGIYKPDQMFGAGGPRITASGEREATFQMKNGVRIIGGYAGFGEPDPNARDIELYQTILSGDLNSDDIEVIDPCDLPTEPTRTENSYHVVTGSGCDKTAILDGFTITAGNANGIDTYSSGGGLHNIFGSPTISNCRFIENTGTWCAGLYNYDRSNPIISNCEFRKNSSRTGSAIGNEEDCSPEITNCTFIQNYASTHGSGAVINKIQCNPTIINCIFSQNYAGGNGGALENINGSNSTIISCDFTDNSTDSYGGAVFNAHESLPTFVNCSFSGNIASSGGGMHNTDNSSPTLTNCTFSENIVVYDGGGMVNTDSSPTLTNCTFSGNSSEGEGGAMANYDGSNPIIIDCTFSRNSSEEAGGGMFNFNNSNPTLTNCTFSRNSAQWDGGGISNNDNSHSTVINCIIWGNTAQNGEQISIDRYSSATVSYSDVQYNGQLPSWPGEGNINIDPLFADPNNGDYHLKSDAGRWDPNSQSWVLDDVNSPCIDTGDPNSPIGDEPIPNGGRINMGAYGGTAEASMSQLSLSEMKASNPYPSNAAVDVEINPTLSWSSGATAVAHDVYFGTSYNNVNNATITNPLNVLASQGQTSNSYSPGTLGYNRTYYWRVDEVDEQGNRIKGDIWLFITRDGGSKGRACFTGQTPVWMDGAFVPISTVAAGQKAGTSDITVVEKLQEHVGMYECRDIILENGNCISVVEAHAFMLESGIWVSSPNLQSGMKLRTMNGSIAIKSVIKREIPYVGKVYNVKVRGTHQYIVGEDAVIVRDY